MAVQRQAITTSVDPETSTADITFGSQSLNTYVDRYGDGRTFTTQRPPFFLSQDVTDDDTGITVSRGRGIHFWESDSSVFIVNGSSVVKGYGGVETEVGTISEGRDRVYFIETPTHLVITDPENNEGWLISLADTSTITLITGTAFPPNNGGQLAGGGAFLGGFVFVMDTDGTIWNSNINDPTTWDGIDLINTEREADRGVFLGSHHDNLVAISTRSIEFYYNAGNPVGSPLGRRNDISYRTGAADDKAVFVQGDSIYFIGNSQIGNSGLYLLSSFQLNKRSNFSIDRALAFYNIKSTNDFFLTAATIDDHILVFVTPVAPDASNSTPIWTPIITLVYDDAASTWTTYSTDIISTIGFAVIDATDISTPFYRNVGLLLTDGNAFQIDGTLDPIDLSYNGLYFLEDYLLNDTGDYLLDQGPITTANIVISVTLPEMDFGTINNKFMHSLSVVGDTLAEASDTLTPLLISWSDDHYKTFSAQRSLYLDTTRELRRFGRFKRRAFKLDYEGSNALRLEALEYDVGVSSYA